MDVTRICEADVMDIFHNDVKRGKRDVRRNLIGLKRTFIIAEPIKFRVSSWKPVKVKGGMAYGMAG